MTAELSAFYILTGVVLLFFGWRLFWLFVAMAGFWAGYDFARYAFAGQTPEFIFIAAIICAVFGVILAVALQEIAIVFLGALVGGTLALHWYAFFVPYDPQSSLNWIAFCGGAIIGALLMAWGFDAALIIVTSLLGATLIVGALPADGIFKLFIALSLMLFGIYVQRVFLESEPRRLSGQRRVR